MEKRTIIAVILSVAVFYLFSFFTGPHKQPQNPVNTPAAVTQLPASPPPPQASTTLSPVHPLPQVPPQLVTVDTPQYTAVFTTAGAALKSLTLKGYREMNTPDAPLVVLGNLADPALPVASTRGAGFVLSPQSLYSPSVQHLVVQSGQQQPLVFTYLAPQGYLVRKTYLFNGSQYGIQLDTELINNSQLSLAGSLQQILTAPFEIKEKNSRYETHGSTVYTDNSLQADPPKAFDKASKRYDKRVEWAGITDKYFLIALLAEHGSIADVEIKKNSSGFLESIIASPAFSLAPGQSVTVSDKLFAGPKDIDILKAQGSSLEQSLNLGWFTILAKPMLHSLKFFYRYVHNYG